MYVNSHHIEFGYELLSAVPHAYMSYLNKQLEGTESGVDTSCLYYFSPNHKEVAGERGFKNIHNAQSKGLPYTFIHKKERPNLVFPPYKEQYKNDLYKWDKPTLVIANRYTKEWGCNPINYFDENMLEWMFSNLKEQYEIIYIAAEVPKEFQDIDQKDIGLNDRVVATKHGVKVFQDIKGESWNESLLKVFANCERYITMNGGYSILASLFGGENIIYSKENFTPRTKELEFGSFWRWYPNHSNQRVVFAGSYDKLKKDIGTLYIKKLPTVNILVRTSKRPNAYNRCIRSINEQDYPNINIVTITDEGEGVKYSQKVRCRQISLTYNHKGQRPVNDNFGRYFPFNRYLDIAQRMVKGYILILDDDNMLNAKNAVSLMVENANPNRLLIWRCKFGNGRIIPNESFNSHIELFDIDSACFLYHSDHIDKTDWSEWKRADYRTAKRLNSYICTRWIDATLTRQQSGSGFGRQVDAKPKLKGMKTVKILHPTAGKVGSVKRLDNAIAAKVVADGLATYIKDVVEELNQVKPRQITDKPKAEENKQLQIEVETKEAKPKVKHTRKSTKK